MASLEFAVDKPVSAPVSPLDALSGANAEFIERLYEAYRRDRGAVDPQWAMFFAGFDLAGGLPGGGVRGGPTAAGAAGASSEAAVMAPAGVSSDLQVADLIHAYRELGHLIANLDPLGHNVTHHPLLELAEFGLTKEDLDRMVVCPPNLGGGRLHVAGVAGEAADDVLRDLRGGVHGYPGPGAAAVAPGADGADAQQGEPGWRGAEEADSTADPGRGL